MVDEAEIDALANANEPENVKLSEALVIILMGVGLAQRTALCAPDSARERGSH
jgi:hypothetical protein